MQWKILESNGIKGIYVAIYSYIIEILQQIINTEALFTDINNKFIGEETYLKTWVIYLRIIKGAGIATIKINLRNKLDMLFQCLLLKYILLYLNKLLWVNSLKKRN